MSKSGIVYKLCCVDTDIERIYIGSTKNFARRKCNHKSNCNNEKSKEYNYNVYQFIRENGGFYNWQMIQLEVVNYETKRDLEAHERRWIEQLKPKLNKQIPMRTKQEWIDDNVEMIKEKKKQYYQDNADKFKHYYQDNSDKIKEKRKQYYQDNGEKIKEKGKQYRNANKEEIAEKKKQYYKDNVDEIKEKKKKYREDNIDKFKANDKKYYLKYKEKISKRHNQKFECDCGGKYIHSNKSIHLKTKKHKFYEEMYNYIYS
jgi:hypothetical protein